jgi:integrase
MTDATPPKAKPVTRRRKGGRRSFGAVRALPSGRFQARYRGPDGVEHAAPTTFASYADADGWLAAQQTDLNRGSWVNPTREGAGVTFAAWSQDWLDTRVAIAPRTRVGYESCLRLHINPVLGPHKLADIRRSTVQRLVARMVDAGAAPKTVSNILIVVSAVFRHAIEDGRLLRNPTQGVQVPTRTHNEISPLLGDEVEALARAASVRPAHRDRPEEEHPEWGLMVRFAAYTGLRAAEITGLRVGRVDLLRGVIDVRQTAYVVQGEMLVDQPTKNRQARQVPIPRGLADDLAAHLAATGHAGSPRAFVFPGPNGEPIRQGWFYNRIFKPAVVRAGLRSNVRFHDLRHTYASRLIDQGESMFTVSRLMGHSSITVTEGTYGHMFPHVLDAAAGRLDTTYRQHTAAPEKTAEIREIGRSATA